MRANNVDQVGTGQLVDLQIDVQQAARRACGDQLVALDFAGRGDFVEHQEGIEADH